jgi:hypothetical protein
VVFCISFMYFFLMFFNYFLKQLLAYMPSLGGPAHNAQRPEYREAKREVYHLVIERLLRSIRTTNEAGGFLATRVIFHFFNVFFNVFIPHFVSHRQDRKSQTFSCLLLASSSTTILRARGCAEFTTTKMPSFPAVNAGCYSTQICIVF